MATATTTISPTDPEVSPSGLSDADAAAALATHGLNELPSAKPRSLFGTILEVVREPMLLLLLACGGTYLLLGNAEEALILLIFVGVVIAITLYQERKTERALEALRDLSSPRALVIRQGQRKRIAGREVVPGDILVLSEGDRVPADALLFSAVNLSTDESLLTGESVPVRKQASAEDLAMARPGGDDLPFVFSGTLVVRGTGLAKHKATGAQTELGKIGKSLREQEQEPTLLQRDTRHMVRVLALVGLALCRLFVVFYGLTRGDWLRGFLAALTLAMAILPEELPVVLTVFLALGAWRISQKRVLTRRVAAIKMLGAATALCVDKTGTLTMNQLSVAKLFANGQAFDFSKPSAVVIPEEFHELAEFAMLASQPDPFDPMDRAIRTLGDEALQGTEHLHANWKVVREYPLAKSLLAISEVWTSPDNAILVIATKGAPEAIADLCPMSGEDAAALNEIVAGMATDGLRVLGVAKAVGSPGSLPDQRHDFNFEFLGLVALADPVRPAVPSAIRECQAAGIRVIMITCDYPGTALSIARQIGQDSPEGAITGPEVAAMNEAVLRDRVSRAHVFARAVLEQKLQLVNALKASHIGIAMGQRGTDVAREAADLVLFDNEFSSIVQTVRLGRRIFDNLKKALAYVFAIHVPIAGLSLCAVLFRWPLILEPIHSAFLELIIDPACSVVFEAEQEEADVMHRPPRPASEHLFNRQMIVTSLLQGTGVLAILLAIFGLALHRGQGANDARTLTFTCLVLANVAMIVTNRSWSLSIRGILKTPNAAMWWVISGAFTVLALALYVPFLRNLFHFSTLHADDIGLCFGSAALSLVWFEAIKAFQWHREPPKVSPHRPPVPPAQS
ncbi:MAG: cation-translocating P-type ATPase [Acidobacteria bacterium]|nr:cation-translocating P-type ATPase [Acidobacteriota bacterium]